MKALVLILFLKIYSPVESVDIPAVDYLDLVCDQSNIYVEKSRRLESSTALYYDNSMSCYYHVTVPAGKTVMCLVKNFDLEREVLNACVDFVNIHDGSSTSAATINASPMCSDVAEGFNFTSTGQDMTVYFRTDSSGQRRGFEFMFVAITTGTCGSDQYACNTSVCIDSSLVCNIYNECGDSGDETNCVYTTESKYEPHDQAALIAGLTVGLFALIVIGLIIGYCCWRQNYWRVFEKRPIKAKEYVHDGTDPALSYPVTKIYYKEQYQGMYKQPTKHETLSYQYNTEVIEKKSDMVTKEEINQAYSE